MKKDIPLEILNIAEKLVFAGFKAYLVGGCVRDLVFGKKPKDWDVATNALPSEVQKIFPESVYENKFGTVAVKTESLDESVRLVEVTTFRIEGKYKDKRHPDDIKFAKTIEEDLSRRDFTINSLAIEIKKRVSQKDEILNAEKLAFIDLYGGQKDVQAKLVRCVGNPNERFNEDALRLIRAIRFSVELNFDIEKITSEAIKKNAKLLNYIAKERIRDEFIRILKSENAGKGIRMLEDLGLLEHIVPELREGINCLQNKHHIYTVWDHNIKSLEYTVSKNYSLEIRLAALLHDLGKPKTKRGEGENATFYGHEVVGAKMVFSVLKRLNFPNTIIEKVVLLVRYHLFYYNVGDVTEAGVRRFIKRVGGENIEDLIKVREADRIGSGVPKAVPYKLRHLLYMIEKVKRDPVSPKMLAIDGSDIMRIAKLTPGPKVGTLLAILLEEVLDEPSKNTKDILTKRVEELSTLSPEELFKLESSAENRKEEFEKGIEEDMKEKFYVK
ncbi:MAG: CCA tRNA nucleotidyltransferase [bacterium]